MPLSGGTHRRGELEALRELLLGLSIFALDCYFAAVQTRAVGLAVALPVLAQTPAAALVRALQLDVTLFTTPVGFTDALTVAALTVETLIDADFLVAAQAKIALAALTRIRGRIAFTLAGAVQGTLAHAAGFASVERVALAFGLLLGKGLTLTVVVAVVLAVFRVAVRAVKTLVAQAFTRRLGALSMPVTLVRALRDFTVFAGVFLRIQAQTRAGLGVTQAASVAPVLADLLLAERARIAGLALTDTVETQAFVAAVLLACGFPDRFLFARRAFPSRETKALGGTFLLQRARAVPAAVLLTSAVRTIVAAKTRVTFTLAATAGTVQVTCSRADCHRAIGTGETIQTETLPLLRT